MVTGLVHRRAAAPPASTTAAPAGAASRHAPARSSCAAARSTPRSCCSSPASGPRTTSSSSASPWSPTCPASAATCRTTSRSTSSTPRKQPVSIGPWLKHRHKPRIGAEWLFLRRGLGATNHFEAGGFVRSNDDVDYPNLMFHFLPIAIRYDGSRPAAEHGYQVHIGPMYSDVRGSVTLRSTRPARAPGAAVQLPVHRERPAGVDRGDPGRPRHPQPAGVRRRSTTASSRPGPSVETDEEILDWVARGRRDGAAPVVHRPDGRRRPCRCSTPSTMRVHGVDGLRVVDASVDALRHQRQHLRPGDDGRREGRRPDPRATRRCRRSTRRSTATARTTRSTRPPPREPQHGDHR